VKDLNHTQAALVLGGFTVAAELALHEDEFDVFLMLAFESSGLPRNFELRGRQKNSHWPP
jgi:hypothetical protein